MEPHLGRDTQAAADARMTVTVGDAAGELVAHRPMLYGVAYRILGSSSDADDVLQDAYLRWRAIERREVHEPRRYLSRMVTRLAIDRLRTRTKQETYVGTWLPEPVPTEHSASDPLDSVEQRDTLATATLYLMERLDPVERAVFVLRSAFDVPYAEIAEIVQRTAEHCRQLYRRASDRLAASAPRFTPSRREHAALLERFLAAARDGDLAALRAVLHDDVVTWSDGGGKVRAARNAVVGVDKCVRFFVGVYGTKRRPAIIPLELNGSPGAVLRDADMYQALTFGVRDGKIAAIFLVSNPDKLAVLRRIERPCFSPSRLP
ncbi:RNA polymerase sigma factor SigJ [Phytoactinopolyspora endophytica]|uniref:RNA polymerase sigma factor SigJ n=1 Tax=Phytoactinopolyspora endophytica TaxID=1642495 RepID=UPI00197B62E8|nr:RNA polymerase sigma factor SigJ [Phytoactinopolyspora endophytica]